MTKLHKHLAEAYKNFDSLRENLEFEGKKKDVELLDKGLEALNRYLAVVEKFDRSKPK